MDAVHKEIVFKKIKTFFIVAIILSVLIGAIYIVRAETITNPVTTQTWVEYPRLTQSFRIGARSQDILVDSVGSAQAFSVRGRIQEFRSSAEEEYYIVDEVIADSIKLHSIDLGGWLEGRYPTVFSLNTPWPYEHQSYDAFITATGGLEGNIITPLLQRKEGSWEHTTSANFTYPGNGWVDIKTASPLRSSRYNVPAGESHKYIINGNTYTVNSGENFEIRYDISSSNIDGTSTQMGEALLSAEIPRNGIAIKRGYYIDGQLQREELVGRPIMLLDFQNGSRTDDRESPSGEVAGFIVDHHRDLARESLEIKREITKYKVEIAPPIITARDHEIWQGEQVPGVAQSDGVEAESGLTNKKFTSYGGTWAGTVSLESNGGISGTATKADINYHTLYNRYNGENR